MCPRLSLNSDPLESLYLSSAVIKAGVHHQGLAVRRNHLDLKVLQKQHAELTTDQLVDLVN